jgi:hypothetical protein
MNDEALRRTLRGVAAPDELDAQRRAWTIVRGAYEDAEIDVRRRWPTRPLVAFAAVLAAIGAALSPPGQAVGGWLRDRVAGEDAPRPALASLPAPGRLLVVSEAGPWIVRRDGSKRLLGAWEDATWSPQGLYVAVTRGPRLAALTPEGDLRWTLTRPPRVEDPRWSPSGFRVAYRSGSTLRVVAGDGSPDRFVSRAVARAPVWRPDDSTNVLGYVTGRRLVRIVDVDSGRLHLSRRSRDPIAEIDWTADGNHLVVSTTGGLEIYGWARGRPQRSSPMFFTGRLKRSVEPAPRGSTIALLGLSGEVALFDVAHPGAGDETVFSSGGRLDELAWSPDGRWLLVSSPDADQWIFVGLRGGRRIVAVSHIVREFDPGGTGPRESPRISGWCCPPESR